MPPTVTDLYRYPVKSCRGQPLRAAPVEPWGLAGDRRWMIVDSGGEVVTARERPRLVLVTPVPEGGAIRLAGPGMPELMVSVPPAGELVTVTPIATLARCRRWDGKVWFGVNLIPDAPRRPGAIRVGDPVQVLEQSEADGPLR
jgi:uncharacterized protein YcbX